MELQYFEDQADLRIKFASMSGFRFVGDAVMEYQGLFLDEDGRRPDWLPPKWDVGDQETVDTRSEYIRAAWSLRSKDGDIAAVEHETGLEILVVIGTGLAVNAISGLVAVAWKEWRRRREQFRDHREKGPLPRSEDRLVVERTVESPDGTRTYQKTEIPAALVTDRIVERLIGQAVGS